MGAYDALVMFEVYTGAKPARPTVLLMLTAGALVGALGLAWIQVRASRKLDGEVRIVDTPLVVRPPRGWIQDPDHPGTFAKAVRAGGWRGKRWVIERKIAFQYERSGVFQPLAYLLELSNHREVVDHASAPEVARIGRFDGVQVRRARVFQWRGRRHVGESVYRLVSTARGDQISVEYTPFGELAPGDMELFDAVCRAVELDDAAVNMDADEAMTRAGVEFRVAESWTITGPDFAEVPGLYVQDHAGGDSRWALGLFRTWLAKGRSPADLLVSFAEEQWPVYTSPVRPKQWTRSDGALLATIERSAFEQAGGQVAAIWVVAQSPAEAVAVFVLTDQAGVSAAGQAAAKLAQEITVVTSYPAGGVEAAEARGREFMTLLGEYGAAPWWGQGEATSYYVGEIYGRPLLVLSHREAIGGDPTRRYRGSERYYAYDRDLDEQRSWAIDEHAEAYTYTIESDFDRRGQPKVVRLHDARDAGGAVIRRNPTPDSRGDAVEIPVGPAFVCPPVDVLPPGWVASQEAGSWLIELLPLRGLATHTQLLTPLEPDAEGRRRVLLIDDYWPRGMIMAFDEGLEMVYQAAPFGRFERITYQEWQEVLQALGR